MSLLAVVQHRLQGFLQHHEEHITASQFRKMLHEAVSTLSLAHLAYPHSAHRSVPEHLRVLGNSSWPRLTSLNLSGLTLDATSAAQLVKGTWPSLTTLNLCHTDLGAEALAYIARSPLPQLDTIDLSYNWLDDEAVLWLTVAAWPKLQRLNLRFNSLHSGGVQALVCSDWPRLKHLNLRSNFVNREATLQLVHAKWPALEELDLSVNPGLDVPALVQGHWLQLQRLTLDDTVLSQEAVALLMSKWSRLQLNIIGKTPRM